LGKIKALVLAAGYSSRMKRNKMLLPFAGSTVLENTLKVFYRAQVDGVAVVLGHKGEKIRQALVSYPLQFIENPDFHQGMSTSVKAGIRALETDPDLAGVMMIPGDMPLVKLETVQGIIKKFQESSCPLIIPVYQGKKGHPVFFARSLFSELKEVAGDIGAREVVRKNLDRCCFLEVNDPGILVDIDCPEEYEKWVKL
jgi:molybdenum cofactor cytidylyltransferase